jgi:hypothetical protein
LVKRIRQWDLRNVRCMDPLTQTTHAADPSLFLISLS